MKKDNDISSEKAPEPVGAYPHAKRVGNLVFLSGVGPRKRGSMEIPGVTLNEKREIVAYDIEKQCHSVFENVKLILEASGAQWEDLVDITVFLTNMKNDFPAFNKIYADYFKDNQPCRTTVEVSALPTSIAIELKCIAAIPA
jgi:2-aminomuconate deaminase